MADNVTGIVLDIPADVLNNIKNADKAIKDLEQTSKKAAQNIKRDFDTTMVSGVEAFIKKVQEAQTKLGNLKMPTIDATGLSSAIQALSQAMATIDKSATTGSNRLTRIANAMTALQTANPDPQLFQNIADGIAKIGNTSQQTIQNVTQLAQVMAQLAKDIRTVQAAQNAQNANTATAAQYNKLYKEQEQIMREILAINRKGRNATVDDLNRLNALNKRYSEIEAQLDRLNRKKQTAASNLARVTGEANVRQNVILGSALGAINSAKQATSLQELQAAYKNLKAVMATVDPKSSAWQQMNAVLGQTKTRIDEIKKEMGEFKNQASQVGDVAGQLKRTLAAAFSISAITGYINKLIETRAQFELQHVALRAILQDKQKADEVFQQVQQMALQSPFSIMQMTTFTKQLAAYRIESEKLVGTTKMLADVSAGLGVDMGRLILAYGQVKAANYLRATEVRQFTEAGLNIAGELATYFSELQGKMVSVGDVMEMITKRMVRFEDVEEVFKRVTSAGGLFYDMQKKQSETLWGQLQRIKDAMSIMFNEIGKSKQGTISTVLTLIRSLINHWRMLAPIITTVGGAMATVLAVQGIKAFISSLRTMGAAVATLALKWKGVESEAAAAAVAERGAAMATGIGLAVTAVTLLAGALYGAYQEAHKLDEEFDRIGNESLSDLNDAIANFTRLTNVITDTSKTYTEHKDALDELKRSFGDILPEQKLSMEYIQSLNGDYQELTATIVKYYQAQEYNKKYEAVLNSDEVKDLREELEDAYNKANTHGDFGMIFPKSQVKDWADTVANELATGKIPRSLDALKKRTQEIFGKDAKVDKIDFDDTIESAEEVVEKLGDISLSTIGAANAQEAFERSMKASKEANDKQRKSIMEQINATKSWIQSYEELKKNIGDTDDKSVDKEIEAYQKKLAELYKQLDDVNAARAELVAQNFKEEVEAETGKLTQLVQTWWNNEQAMKSLEKQGKKNSDTYKVLEGAQDKIVESANALAEEFGTKVDWALVETQNTSNDLGKVLNSLATSAFPKVAAKAIESMKKAHEAVLVTEGGILSFVDKIIKLLPDDWAAKLPDVGKWIADNDKELAALRGELNGVEVEAKETSESIADIYSRRAKVNVDKFGADMTKIDRIIKQGADTPREMAEALRGAAKNWEESYTAYQKSTNKADWLKLYTETEESMSLMEKNIKAANALADEIWAEPDKGRKGDGRSEDAELKRWQNIKKAIEDTAKAYEEYRNSFSKDAADKMIDEQFGKAFSALGVKISDYFKDGVFDTQALIDALKKLQGQLANTSSARAKALNDLLLEIESKGINLKVKLAEQSEKDLKSQIDEMFANYELTKTLGKLGLNVDLTYLVGGKPMTLDDIRKKLSEMRAADDGSEGAKNRIKIYEEAEKKITDLENKNAIERLKNYNKYLLKSMSERVQIELKAQQEISKIREDATLDDFSKEQAINNVRKKMQEDLTKYDFDQFKGSDVYLQTFKDLESASKEQLQYVIDKLKELSSVNKDLSPLQVKAIVQEIKKAEDALGDKAAITSVFSNFAKSIKYAKERGQLLQRQVQLQKDLDAARKRQSKEEKKLHDLTQQRDAIQNKSSEQWQQANGEVLKQQAAVEFINGQVGKIQENLKGVTDQISAGEKAWNDFRGSVSKVRDALGQATEAMTSVFEGLDSMGLVSDSMRDGFESVSEILGGIDKTMQGLESIDITKPFSIITGTAKTIGGIFSTIGGFFGIGDKKKERQIKRLQEKVEDLQKAYEKLQTAIEEAYAFDDYNAGYNQSMRNLQEQRDAIEEQMRLEEAKKKTDKEKIREYEDALDELEEKEKELREARYEAMGSVSQKDILSEAENWVKTWLDAYKETGDGLDALGEHWDEFFENLVLKQAASAVVSKRMKKYVDQINAAIDSGVTGLSLSQTFAQIGQNLKSELGAWNEDLKAFFDAVGIKGGQGELLLSDLQKGIQNITEPQAAAIEAYLNSMRFAVFEQNNILTNMLAAIQAQYGSNDNSSMLQEVRAIRSLVSSIDDKLSRVVVSRSSQNTNYIVKVG